MFMRRAYGPRSAAVWHHLHDHEVALLAASVSAAAAAGRPGVLLGVGAGCWALVRQRTWFAVLCAGLLAATIVLSHRAILELQPRQLGAFDGWAEIAADPAPVGRGVRLTLEVEGERFDAWVYGRERADAAVRAAGERVRVIGERVALERPDRRAAVRHVVGRFRLEYLGDVSSGNGVSRLSNRVRRALRTSALRSMVPDEAALFTGLVIGDDAAQPRWMVDEFRAAGLSHLTAVSGQNVAYVLLAATPLLRRLRPGWRWAATIALIAWFMALTRFEPSVVRAGVMAGLAATAFAIGGRASPLRLVAWAVTVVVLADPLIVWSVGFWLSVGATVGVSVLGPRLASAFPGPSWFRSGAGVVLGAQLGVALPSILVFRRLPLMSLLANPMAVPVAGVVMLVGLPSGLVAAGLPGAMCRVLMAPSVLCTRWVALVARVAARLEPPAQWVWVGWALVVAAVVVLVVRGTRASHRHVPI